MAQILKAYYYKTSSLNLRSNENDLTLANWRDGAGSPILIGPATALKGLGFRSQDVGLTIHYDYPETFSEMISQADMGWKMDTEAIYIDIETRALQDRIPSPELLRLRDRTREDWEEA